MTVIILAAGLTVLFAVCCIWACVVAAGRRERKWGNGVQIQENTFHSGGEGAGGKDGELL